MQAPRMDAAPRGCRACLRGWLCQAWALGRTPGAHTPNAAAARAPHRSLPLPLRTLVSVLGGRTASWEQALRVNESNFSCRNVCNKYRVAIKSGNCRCRLWWVRLLQEFSFPAVTVLLYVLFHCTHPFVCLFSVFIDQTCKACGVPGKHCSTLVTGSQVKFVPMGNFQKHGDCICFPPSRALVPNCCSFQMAVALFVFCLSLLLLVNRLYFLEQLQVYRKLRTYPEFPHSQFPLF